MKITAFLPMITWVLFTGDVLNPFNWILGYIIGYGFFKLSERFFQYGISKGVYHPSEKERMASWISYFKRPQKFVKFGYLFVRSVISSTIEMATVVVRSPWNKDLFHPAIVEIPLDIKKLHSITVLSNWITLTPGTLTMYVSDDRSRLFVHTYDVGEGVDVFRAGIKDDFESVVKEMFEP